MRSHARVEKNVLINQQLNCSTKMILPWQFCYCSYSYSPQYGIELLYGLGKEDLL